MTRLQVQGLSKAFPGQPVLRGLDLELAGEGVWAILGPSGCGKTTLLRLIAGFERPDGGSILLDGRMVCGDGAYVPPERRRIGYVPQEGALFPHLTVAGNVGFGLDKAGRRSGRVEEVLELVGLRHLAQRMPHELSGGQQQRVSLARALAPGPSLLLLDEPFSSLDSQLRVTVREEVQRVLEAARTTAIVVTHDQAEAFSMAGQVGVMRGGQLIQVAPPETIYWQPVDATVARAGGEAIFVPGSVRGGRSESVFGSLPLRGELPDGPAMVMVRPEQLRTGPAGDGPRARVLAVRFLGAYSDVDLEFLEEAKADPNQVTSRIRSYIAPAPGTIVSLNVEGEVTAFPQPPASA